MLLRMKHVSVFSTTITLDEDPDVPGHRYVLANGMYEHVPGSTTPLPSNFALMRTIYDHYRVVGSKITYIIIQAEGSRTTAFTGNLVTYIDDDGSNARTINELAMIPGGFQKTVSFPARGQTKMTRKWSMKKTFGKDAPIVTLQGSATTNPQELSYYLLAGALLTQDAAAQSVILSVQVRVEYTAIWSERKEVVL